MTPQEKLQQGDEVCASTLRAAAITAAARVSDEDIARDSRHRLRRLLGLKVAA